MAELKQQESSPMGKKSMYMIFRFYEGPIRYTLYAFTNIVLNHTPDKQPLRPIAILQMPRDRFPAGMGFVALGSKLYCIGGEYHKGKDILLSKRVYVVDLSIMEPCDNEKLSLSPKTGKEKRSPFVRIANMHRGMCYPYVFALNGKIYAIDGCRSIDFADFTAKQKINFEVFNPEVGKWRILPRHKHDNLISGHAAVGDRVFFRSHRSDRWDHRCILSSFDMKNEKWFHEKVEDKFLSFRKSKESKEDEVIGDYISAWTETFKEQEIIGGGVIANDTLYALKQGCIGAYHVSNNEDDRSIPCDILSGIKIKFSGKLVESKDNSRRSVLVDEAELVHFWDDKFCLVTGVPPTHLPRYANMNKELVLLTFQAVKQRRSESDQFFWWADIYDFRAVEGIDANLGMVLYTCVA